MELFTDSQNVITSHYEPSKTWDLIDTSIATTIVKRSANITLPRLIFNFTLKRHSAIFVAVLAVPVLCKYLNDRRLTSS